MYAAKFTKDEGPLSMSEADLASLENRHNQFITDGRHIRQHLTHCEYGDRQALDGFDAMLAYIGVLDEVKNPKPITQPTAEMACYDDDLEAFINHSTTQGRTFP